MDGTCLNSHHEFSDRTLRTLRRLSANNVVIAFATGRSSLSVMSYLGQLQLAQASVPVVCFNGSVGFSVNSVSNEVSKLFSKLIPRAGARKLVEFANSRGHVVQYYDGTSGVVFAVPRNESHRVLLARYAALVGREQTLVESFDQLLEEIEPAKLLMLTEDVAPLLEECKTEGFNGEFHTIRGSPEPAWFVEFLLPNTNKGTALLQLSESLSIPLHEIVSFGDGDNDIEMLSCGCHGVAMLNGREVVRLAATEVTEFTNNDDGVAIHLEQLEELGYFSVDSN
jgi:Cof subfamily protein (haloacid dehalogenase superfamily)